jgi:DNA ligase 1
MKSTDLSSRRAFFSVLAGAWMGLRGAAAQAAAPALLLAQDASPDVDPAGFLVSEKLDGVRALWDGQALRFRSGRIVPAPGWFLARLPATPLDGELWLGRGSFDALSGRVRRQVAVDSEWQQIRYMVFELPGGEGSFAARAARIRAIADAAQWPSLVAVEQFTLPDRATLLQRLADVVRAGGEGLMLHRSDAPYRAGRHDALLKLKPLHDAEAVVVGHVAGRGRLAGRLGALQVRDGQGREFLIGTGFSDAERAAPPPLGSAVTYTHRGFTRTGLPRFASFLRLHHGF